MAPSREKIIRNAEKYISRGRIEAGIKEYRKLLVQNPKDISTLNRVGDLYARIDRTDQAISLFTQIAEQYSKDGFFVKAIAIYKKIIKQDPQRLSVYESLAELYHRQGLTTEARSQYQVLAEHYDKLEDSKSAIGIYRRMVELEPDNPSNRARLAELYRAQGDVQKALKEYGLIADLMLRHGHSEQASQVYERSLDISSEDIGFLTDAVLKLKAAGANAAAVRFLDKAIEENPAAERIHRLVGLGGADGETTGADGETTGADGETAEAGEASVDPSATVMVSAPGAAPTQDDAVPAADVDPTGDEAEGEPIFSEDDLLSATFELDLGDDQPESLVSPPADMLDGPRTPGSAWTEEADKATDESSPAADGASAESTPAEVTSEADVVAEAEAPYELVESVSEAEPASPGILEDTMEFELNLDSDGDDLLAGTLTSGADDAETAIDHEALERTVAEVESAPSRLEADLMTEAEVLIKYGMTAKALERFDELLDRDPENLPALALSVDLLVDQNEPSELERTAELGCRLAAVSTRTGHTDRWNDLREKLGRAGYTIKGLRVEPPAEPQIASTTADSEADEADSIAFDDEPAGSGLITLVEPEEIEAEAAQSDGVQLDEAQPDEVQPGQIEPERTEPTESVALENGELDQVQAAEAVDLEAAEQASVAEQGPAGDVVAESEEDAEPDVAAVDLVADAESVSSEGLEADVAEAAVDDPDAGEDDLAVDPETVAALASDPSQTEAEAVQPEAEESAASQPAMTLDEEAAAAEQDLQDGEALGAEFVVDASEDEAEIGLLDLEDLAPPQLPETDDESAVAQEPGSTDSVKSTDSAESQEPEPETSVTVEAADELFAPDEPEALDEDESLDELDEPEAVELVSAEPELEAEPESEPEPEIEVEADAEFVDETEPPEAQPKKRRRSITRDITAALEELASGVFKRSKKKTEDAAASDLVEDDVPDHVPTDIAPEAPVVEPVVETPPPAPAEAIETPAALDPLRALGDSLREEIDGIKLGDSAPAAAGAEIPVPPVPEIDESPLDDSGTSWLDAVAADGSTEEALFEDEDEFFDLGAELEQELSREEALTATSEDWSQPQEQGLDDIIEGFKRGVQESLSEEDYETHFNLGIAYREMGLLDEAIGEFQIAAKDAGFLATAASMLGVCFLEKGMPELAIKWYRRGLEAPDVSEENLLGLLYDLGHAYTTVGDHGAAYEVFTEVYGTNSGFRDVSNRLSELGRPQ